MFCQLISDLRPVNAIIGGDNGAGLRVLGIGAVNTDMNNVYYVPGINANLVSVKQITADGMKIQIEGGVCTITRGSDGCVVGKAHMSGGVYEVEFLKVHLN
ncbi:hypothetical protein E2562_024312 [Oryza meyeriana var. granulata]|uniref:Uncharacterized protein n=1 Tax=Oryza meyeriana var. granulata TaxID=110450 RepID=A0A6G1CA06_9ORYZ|nr:hypothetical protein E2562_024312 [Oryza meyeriana var. granulata]